MNNPSVLAPAPVPARALRPRISVVVPAFNEATNLPALLAVLTATLRDVTDQWEVLVVDDGSRDATPVAMLSWLVEPGVRYVRLSRNFGKECALTAGIEHAQGEVVVCMDADLQHPVEMIAPMLARWRDGVDMVCATRATRADESLAKRVGTWLFYRLVNTNRMVQIPVDAGDFRLMDRRVVDALKSLPERNRFMKGLFAWVGFRTEILPYTPHERASGKSSFSIRGLARLAFTGVTSFTNFPLRLWSALGILIAFGAMLFGLWIVFEHFFEARPVPGWATLATSMLFFSGVQLLSIGILGEYVGRIFDEVKQRPIYIVASELGRSNFADPEA
ncbi:glycosyltransferase family 2 protein [Rhodoferax sp.]|uniref:glycosyltransferase family 2 protein n=1 Tax=Rhodoferax sp. TaxID=50421 RepID=UPI0025CD41D6|nr:glycosyltransferase family 2 protein [Rhodoferax sp.]